MQPRLKLRVRKKEQDMSEAVIKIKSVQHDGNDKNETEVITEGSFRKIQSGYELCYDETDATGYEGSKTVLKILDGSRIELLRSGTFSSELYIERGRKNFSLYGTPFGEMKIGVQAKNVESLLTDIGGKVKASYVIDINSTLLGNYDLEIDVRCS